jgi:hypothetical protein
MTSPVPCSLAIPELTNLTSVTFLTPKNTIIISPAFGKPRTTPLATTYFLTLIYWEP